MSWGSVAKNVLFQFYPKCFYSSEDPTNPFFELSKRVLENVYGLCTNPKRWYKLFVIIWKSNQIHNFPYVYFPHIYLYWASIAKTKHLLRCILVSGVVRSRKSIGISNKSFKCVQMFQICLSISHGSWQGHNFGRWVEKFQYAPRFGWKYAKNGHF